MFRWNPWTCPPSTSQHELQKKIREIVKTGSHTVLYFTPERGWWGYSQSDIEIPFDLAKIRTVMDTHGNLRTISVDTILRAAEAVKGEFPHDA